MESVECRERQAERMVESFDFEKLIAYQKSLDFVEQVFSLCDGLPSSFQSSLGDQLRRAALSVVNNIAEGSGQKSLPQKRRYLECAWNSARECIPMFEIIKRRGKMPDGAEPTYRSLCAECCRLVGGLLKSLS